MAAPTSKMILWGDMTSEQREKRAVFLVRRKGMSYSQAAEYLCASKNAIAGALSRAEGRAPSSSRQKSGETRSLWTEARLTETYEARKRRLAREREQFSAATM
jgi:transposase